MMGPRTLAEIKTGLRAALARSGKDPIEWLERRIAQLGKAAKPDLREIELLQGLCHVLQDAGNAKPSRKSKRRRAPAASSPRVDAR
jgi:hypothetical protein